MTRIKPFSSKPCTMQLITRWLSLSVLLVVSLPAHADFSWFERHWAIDKEETVIRNDGKMSVDVFERVYRDNGGVMELKVQDGMIDFIDMLKTHSVPYSISALDDERAQVFMEDVHVVILRTEFGFCMNQFSGEVIAADPKTKQEVKELSLCFRPSVELAD